MRTAVEKTQLVVVIGMCIANGVWIIRSGSPLWFSLLFAATILLALGLAGAALWPVVFRRRPD